MRGRPRPDQGARGREGRPLALEAAALQVPAQARARLRREDAHRPQEGQLDPGALVLDRVDKVRGGADNDALAYYVDAVRRAAEEKARLEGLVEGEARKPRWRRRVDSLRCLKGVDTASAADLVFEAGEFSRFRNARSFAAWVGLTPSEHSSGESDRRGAITKAGNKHLRKTLVEAAWHYLTCSGRPKDLAKGQAPDRGARRHAAKGVRRLVERREALLARGVHGNKANVATARELACWVWAVGLMAEEA